MAAVIGRRLRLGLRLGLAPVMVMAAMMFSNTASEAADEKPLSDGNLVVVDMTAAELQAHKIEPIALGDVELPSGQVVAADPLVQPERPAFARKVPPGRYPVTLYKAQYRIALAGLRFAPGKVVRWEMATIPGQDLATLKADEIYGYGVDAGLGCFMDAGANLAIEKREAQQKAQARNYSNYYDDVLAEDLAANGDTYVMHRPLPDSPLNIAVFQSGWGDGFYASYWGLDAENKPLVLVTDFSVMTNADGRSDYDKRHEAAIAAMSPDEREASREGAEALEKNDLPRLQALLASGRIRPDTYIEAKGENFISEAIRLDKPAVLEMLVRYGAKPEAPAASYDWLPEKTYPAFTRWLAERSRDPETARKRAENGLGPVSAELLDVVARWEAGKIPLADDRPAPQTGTQEPKP
ncbi:MAG: hypothetical protein BGP04_19715 [Rhizobiales bacterium 62-17]|nr:DUF4241 domain-containing protein [Hyphomicrobiales bacterium]OJX99888.1 MAG: hypothetical protein BGP04_19715 [Rhizobiales bacterium 62-17]